MRSIYHPTLYTAVSKNRFGVQTARQKPHAFRWWTPDCDPNLDGEGLCRGEEPALVNNFEQPSPASGLERFAFRLNADGRLQTKGYLDVSLASSGDVAWIMPGVNAGETDFIPDLSNSDALSLRVTTSGDKESVTAAVGHIDQATGEVTVHWQLSGTAIYEIEVFEPPNTVVVGDDRFRWHIPEDLDGAMIVSVEASLGTAGGGSTQIQFRLSDGCTTGADILSTKLTIDAGECNSIDSATQPVISGTPTVAHGDHLHIDVDASGGGLGLTVSVALANAGIASVILQGAQGPPGGATSFEGPFPGGPGASDTPGGAGSSWTTSTSYEEGDTVENDGTYYVTTVDHTSSATNEPGTGVDWEDFWVVLTYQEGDVVSNGGTTYVALVDHTATVDNEPGVGADWEDFWMVLVQGHEPYSGIVTMILGNGFELDVGVKAAIPIPFDCEIIEATLLANAAGDVVVDLWKDTYGAYPPTDADSITAATPLELVAANKTTDTALTGWDTTLTTGDVLMVVIESTDNLNWLSVGLRVQRP